MENMLIDKHFTPAEMINSLRSETGLGLVECSKILKKCKWDYRARLYYVKNGKSPFYYVIQSVDTYGMITDIMIVTDEDIAKDYCEKNIHKYFGIKYSTHRLDDKEES